MQYHYNERLLYPSLVAWGTTRTIILENLEWSVISIGLDPKKSGLRRISCQDSDKVRSQSLQLSKT